VVKITDFAVPCRPDEPAKTKIPLLPLPAEQQQQQRHGGAEASRRTDDPPAARGFYRPVVAPSERQPSGPDPGRIGIRNSLRETLLSRHETEQPGASKGTPGDA